PLFFLLFQSVPFGQPTRLPELEPFQGNKFIVGLPFSLAQPGQSRGSFGIGTGIPNPRLEIRDCGHGNPQAANQVLTVWMIESEGEGEQAGFSPWINRLGRIKNRRLTFANLAIDGPTGNRV
ncbi:MAG: hypothetical protein ACK55I_15895, partial [bacterium]